MFRKKTQEERLIEERRKTAQLNNKFNQAVADLEYIAMMCDVELATGEEIEDEQI